MPSSVSTGTKLRAVGKVLSASCTLEQTQTCSGPSTPPASPHSCTGSVPPPVFFCNYAKFYPLCRNNLPSRTKLRFLAIVFLNVLPPIATCIFVPFPSSSEDKASFLLTVGPGPALRPRLSPWPSATALSYSFLPENIFNFSLSSCLLV